MTITNMLTLARLKELQALERLRRALVLDAHDPDWTYCLSAMDERLFQLRALLSRDDPQALRDCEQRLAEERGETYLWTSARDCGPGRPHSLTGVIYTGSYRPVRRRRLV